MDTDRIIRQVWHVKPGDTLPYTGWGMTSREDHLLRVYAECGFTRGAEIGVSEGRFSQAMLDKVPGLQLLSVDPYAAYGRVSQRVCDVRYEHAVQRLAPYPGSTIVRKTSMEASRDVPDGSLDFVFIDGDHRFEAVMLDIILWAPKVRAGGIVSGHDLYYFYQSGVPYAVHAYTQAHNLTWYITRDKEASWLWVQR